MPSYNPIPILDPTALPYFRQVQWMVLLLIKWKATGLTSMDPVDAIITFTYGF